VALLRKESAHRRWALHGSGEFLRLLWMNLARLVFVGRVLTRYCGAHGLSLLVRRWPFLRRFRAASVNGPDRLRMLFEALGGTFLKFGQMLALQPDILSLEYCNSLLNLLDRIAPFPYEEVERVFETEIGLKPDEAFEFFDPQPLATASVGQVHVAFKDGRKYAVKIQRPSAQADFAGDMRLMAASLWLIRRLHLRFLTWLIEPISEFLAWTREELDFRTEAAYMRQLRENARANPNERVPQLLEEFVTRRTLVMEFLPGTTVLAYLRAIEHGNVPLLRRLDAEGFESSKVAERIIDNFLGDVFKYGLFHADLHPANLMILPGNVVGYVDFGITGCISAYSRQNLIALTLAYTSGDLRGMCDAFFHVSAMDSGTSAARFHQGLARDAGEWYEKHGRGVRLRKNFTLVMLDMLRLSRESGVWPERDVIKYIRSAIAIDGLITRFAPAFDLGRHLRRTCDRYLKWHIRRSLLTMNTLIGWTASTVHLTRDGGLRIFSALQRASGAYRPEPSSRKAPPRSPGPLRAVMALLLAVMTVTVGWPRGQAARGWTWSIAELALAAAFCSLVFRLDRFRSGAHRHARAD
jgi:ubiquinone biosynthesis protein